MSELIDTCWDVNQGEIYVTFKVNNELIDTCWDVNVISLSLNNR